MSLPTGWVASEIVSVREAGRGRLFCGWFVVFVSEPGALELGGFCHPVMKWLFWERNPEQRESSVRLGGQTGMCYSGP